MRGRAAIVASAACLLVLVLYLGRPPAAPVSAQPPVHAAEWSSEPAHPPIWFSLGINEAVSVPNKLVSSGQMDRAAVAAHLRRDAERTVDLGARFVRGNTGAFPHSSWSASRTERDAADYTDVWVTTVQGHDLEPVMMIGPWPGNRTFTYTDRYVPEDLPAYAAWVRAIAERYDGDGIEDMPGLRGPIRYWEVDNEPDLKFTAPRNTDDVPAGSFCTPAEAGHILVTTAREIRAAYPDALVLNGGIFRPASRTGQRYLSDLMEQPGVPRAFQILSLHAYTSDEPGRRYAEGLAAARTIAGGKPIFVTETSVPSRGEESWMNPAWQARMVASVIARGAIAGAEAVFWHTLSDPPPDVDLKSGFKLHSLLETAEDGTVSEKPAARVFRNLARQLAADDLYGAVQEDGGARLRSGALLLYEGARSAPRGGVNLLDASSIPAGSSASAPAWLAP